jgi:hypothetical protein
MEKDFNTTDTKGREGAQRKNKKLKTKLLSFTPRACPAMVMFLAHLLKGKLAGLAETDRALSKGIKDREQRAVRRSSVRGGSSRFVETKGETNGGKHE